MSGGSSRQAPLAMDAATFNTLGHQLVDQLTELLAKLPQRPVGADRSPSALRATMGLDTPLPEDGRDPATLLSETARHLFDHSVFNGHPRFFGYITASPAPIGILGHFLASALNPNVALWTLAPAATAIEEQTVRWIGELIGFSTGSGILVSGGNAANIVCLLAARAAAATWDVRTEGIRGGRELVAYASTEAHTWIQKAADMCGLGTRAIRWIPTDARQQMDVAALRTAIDTDIAAGRLPFIVVGTAGAVSTGAVDPLPAIAALCREKRIWFHVDGAYGGFAAALPDAPSDLYGLREADSLAVDPHKWLYAPLEAGCALVRDADALTRAFAYHPPYYNFDEHATNYVELGPQNSRGFRALKVWLTLRQVGARGYRRMIADDIALAHDLAVAVERHRDLELLTQALSITTFRYVPDDLRARRDDREVASYLNLLNEALLDRLQRGGDLFVSNALVGDRYALRACIVNFHTDASDIAAVPEIVVRYGRALDDERRPRALVSAAPRSVEAI